MNEQSTPCNCNEFLYIGEPDETGVIITHKDCGALEFLAIEDLPAFKAAFPDTGKYEGKTSEAAKEQDETELWAELLEKLPSICMYAPMHEPQRRTYIMNQLKSKYKISRHS